MEKPFSDMHGTRQGFEVETTGEREGKGILQGGKIPRKKKG